MIKYLIVILFVLFQYNSYSQTKDVRDFNFVNVSTLDTIPAIGNGLDKIFHAGDLMINSIYVSNDTLFINEGNSTYFAVGVGATSPQTLSYGALGIDSLQIQISEGNIIHIPIADLDANPYNELQLLTVDSTANDSVYLSILSGNQVSFAVGSGGGSTYIVSNGITESNDSLMLGGDLIETTEINILGNDFSIIGDSGSFNVDVNGTELKIDSSLFSVTKDSALFEINDSVITIVQKGKPFSVNNGNKGFHSGYDANLSDLMGDSMSFLGVKVVDLTNLRLSFMGEFIDYSGIDRYFGFRVIDFATQGHYKLTVDELGFNLGAQDLGTGLVRSAIGADLDNVSMSRRGFGNVINTALTLTDSAIAFTQDTMVAKMDFKDLTEHRDYKWQDTSGTIALVETIPTRNFDRTQWSMSFTGSIPVNNGNTFDILDSLDIDDKSVNGTDTGDGELTITTGARNYIQCNWQGVPEVITIRVNFDLNMGGTQTMALELRRQSDNTLISSIPVAHAGNDYDPKSATFTTYIGGATDPFVTDGFYIQINNQTGANATLETGFNVLIIRQYRNPLN